MDREPLPDDIPRLLREALEALVAPFRPLFIEAGITEQQWRVLRTLVGGPRSQVEIAAACAMQPASLSGVLARMEQGGLVRRDRSAADQRRVQVSLTADSQELIERLAPQIGAEYEAIAAAVGGETLTALARSAAAVRDALAG